MSMSNGRLKSILMSSRLSVSPIVSIIIPNIILAASPFTHSNNTGKKNAITAAIITNSEDFDDNNLLICASMRIFVYRTIIGAITDTETEAIESQKRIVRYANSPWKRTQSQLFLNLLCKGNNNSRN